VQLAERGVRRPQLHVAATRSRRGQRENAEFVAITQLVQDWDSIAPWLVESLFADELYRRAFLAIAATSGDLGGALQEADPEAREVLERAAVVDLEVDAEVEARNLIAAAVRRELGRTASTNDPALELDDRGARLRLEDLGEQEHAADAAEWLLVWLAGRTEGR
jgi:DNA primase